jgi:hypothetical protein
MKSLSKAGAFFVVIGLVCASSYAQPNAEPATPAAVSSPRVASSPSTPPGLDFSSLHSPSPPSEEALVRYGELTDTTILRVAGLPVLAGSLTADLPADTNKAAAALKSALLGQGIELVPLHGLFTMAVRSGWSDSPLAALIARLPTEGVEERPVPAGTQQGPAGELIAPGMIYFNNADLNQALQLYVELANKTLLRSAQLPMVLLKLKTQTTMSKSAAIYALRASLALQGLAVVPVGEKFEAILPFTEVARFAPPEAKPVAGETVIALSDIPQFRRGATAQQLLDYYAGLAERTAAAAPGLGESRILFKAQTPLAKSELLQGVETVLRLNGVTIVEVDDKTIRLERYKRAGK